MLFVLVLWRMLMSEIVIKHDNIHIIETRTFILEPLFVFSMFGDMRQKQLHPHLFVSRCQNE